ncbi:MAG: bacterial/archaeal transporter family-2 protein [Rhodobacteraceae bacterium HLUCCA12]|nr:MAG: bacterial/archaeal transporter family-2 protein [Rhodobacteraceae bacterium HLUCCA12]
MSGATLFALAVVVVAGGVLSSQAPINAALARAAGDPIVAACINFLVGFLVLAVVWAMRGTGLPRELVATAPPWVWIGGAMGAFYMSALIWAVPTIGAFSATMGIVLGQLVAALLLDRYGAFGLPVHDISWTRLAGMALVLAGLALSRV